MSIPTLPPENLYKFMVLTGVFIAVACLGVLEHRLSKQTELDVGLALSVESMGHLERNFFRTLARIEAAEASEGSIRSAIESGGVPGSTGEGRPGTPTDERERSEPQKVSFEAGMRDLKQQLDEDVFRELLADGARIMEARRKSEVAENYQQRSSRIAGWLMLGGVNGLILACFGFYFWYVRVQRYQDAIVRNQAVHASDEVDGVFE